MFLLDRRKLRTISRVLFALIIRSGQNPAARQATSHPSSKRRCKSAQQQQQEMTNKKIAKRKT